MKSNTMLKHLGVCRAAGGEKPPKSEGSGSSTGAETAGVAGGNARERGWRERTSESGDELTRLDFKTTETQRIISLGV